MIFLSQKRLESISADEMMKRSGLPAANLGYINKIKGDRLSGGVNSLGEEVAASDGDSTVSGSVLQQHLEELSFFLGHNDAALRIASVNLIGVFMNMNVLS